MEYLSEGLAASAIARHMFVSRRTVESHLSSAYHKLGVTGRIEATNLYRRYREMFAGRP
jgi:LuxR family transcriptional regulator, maltose regulon positive regulatory protein